jgi:hypothetical protein
VSSIDLPTDPPIELPISVPRIVAVVLPCPCPTSEPITPPNTPPITMPACSRFGGDEQEAKSDTPATSITIADFTFMIHLSFNAKEIPSFEI